MNAIGDFFALAARLVSQLWGASPRDFLVIAGVGVVLAGLSWWLAHAVSIGFNRHFSFKPEHYAYCSVAAVATFLFTLVFFALRYTADVAQTMVTLWEVEIRADQTWANDTFAKAYRTVEALRDPKGLPLEDFTHHPRPETGVATVIPTSQEASKRAGAEVYGEAAVAHFDAHHRFLRKILWARSGIAQEQIYADMQRVFGSGSRSYDAVDAIRLAGREIRRGLEEQVPRVVVASRIILVVAFFLVQGVTFLLLIRAALADIKVRQASASAGVH